ncbi:MAG: hypothetical protein IT454_16410 [Planctomycetes bacterium]|nr:hypothetical protein [Planctomycetota bacterium]
MQNVSSSRIRLRTVLLLGAVAGLIVFGVALAVRHFELHGAIVGAALVLVLAAGPVIARAGRR